MSEEKPRKRLDRLPLLAVRDVVVFPHMVLPLSVGRAKSIKALEAAMKETDKLLCVVARSSLRVLNHLYQIDVSVPTRKNVASEKFNPSRVHGA